MKTFLHRTISGFLRSLLIESSCKSAIVKLLIKLTAPFHPYIEYNHREINSIAAVTRILCSREKIKRSLVSGAGVLILFSENRAYYIALGRMPSLSLNKSYNNWTEIKNSAINCLVTKDWQIEYLKGKMILSNEILFPLKKSENSPDKIIRVFQKEGRFLTIPQKTILAWEKTVSILSGATIAKKWSKITNKILEYYWTIGPTHGDLTPLNVMKRNGDYKLIDLDRFSWEGIQIFDLIHYETEKHCKAFKTDWIELCFNRKLLNLINKNIINFAPMFVRPKVTNLKVFEIIYILERLRYELRNSPNNAPTTWKNRSKILLESYHCIL